MPWPAHPPGALPPLIEWHGAEPPAEIAINERIRTFLARPAYRARILEIDGSICATLVAANYDPDDPEPLLERIDVILQHKHVVLRRRKITGACAALSPERIADEWDQTPPDQRDASVLFLQIIDAVVDSSTEVLDEIRRRVGLLEERMLASNPTLNQVLSGLLELSHHLGRLRDGLLPLRGDIRELAELRSPVERQIISPAAERWLRSIETDLTQDVPAALSVADARIAGALLQLQGERSEATNRVVLLLTIITVAFFIPTLLTGLYGMNVPLPRQHQGWLFWSVLGIAVSFFCVAAAAITRLGLWGTFRSVLPGPGLSLRPDLTVIPTHPPLDAADSG
jgi:magnesium transporter